MTPQEGHHIKGKYVAFRDVVIKVINDFLSGRITIGVGAILLVLALLFVVAYPCPTQMQYLAIRILLAIGALCLSLGFLSFLNEGKHVPIIKAVWSITVFLFAYLSNPASLMISDDCKMHYDFMEGRVVLSGEPVEGVVLTIAEQEHVSNTNRSGEFFLPFYENETGTNRIVELSWKGFDTSINFNNVSPETAVRIELPKHLVYPPEKVLERLLFQRTSRCESWVRASHQGYLDRYPKGREAALQELVRSAAPYDKIDSKQRNYYAFNNGYHEIRYKKNLTAIGVNPGDYKVENSFLLEDFKPFLLEKRIDGKPFHLIYTLMNTRPIKADILSVMPQDDGTCRVLVNYQQPVRYVFVTHHYDSETQWYRKRSMEFSGLKPNETLVLERTNNKWGLVGIE